MTTSLRGLCLLLLFAAAGPALAAQPDFAALYRRYEQAGGRDFSAARGRDAWLREHAGEDGKPMSCVTCHGADLRAPGRQHKTGKPVEPMAPSANPARYTDPAKVEKWFTRNCKQVMKRECSAQEKGDILRYLSQF